MAKRLKKILVIYGEGSSGLHAETHYENLGFTAIIHREAQFFEGPETHVAGYAIESEHTTSILAIREAYANTGIKDVSRNKDLRFDQANDASGDEPNKANNDGEEGKPDSPANTLTPRRRR